MVSLHEQRAARNEAIFRQVNERIVELERRFHDDHDDSMLQLVCECAIADCMAAIEVPVRVYGSVRANPRHFLLRPGHQRPGIERIVEEQPGYVIVEKRDDAGEIAEDTDPR